jgi:DNA-binding protein H-NS
MKELSSIRKQILELQQKEQQLIQEGKLQAIAQIKTIMAESGVTVSDLSTKKKKIASSSVVVLYRDGGNTWSGGRGRKPKWVTDAISNGIDLEKFRV